MKELFEKFTKKELQKTNQTEFRVEKVKKGKDYQLCVKMERLQ